MENMKLRCHFSIIFENMWSLLIIIPLILIQEIEVLIEAFEALKSEGIDAFAAIGGITIPLGLLAVLLVIFLFQFLRWRKTWIILEDNLVIIERNTINKKKNTIAIENISAVNMERNIFERLVGTYRIKMDTNSATTADETDISIVFKEADAVHFRKTVLERMNALKGNTDEAAVSAEVVPDEVFEAAFGDRKIFKSSTKDLILYAFYTLPLSIVLLAAAGIGGLAWVSHNYGLGVFVKEALGGFLAVVLMTVSAIYNLIKRFIKCYGFTAYRDGKDIHIRYGLIKMVSYTIPVDKITAIHIEQPLISRIFKRYNAKIITVGLGDEQGEDTNLTLSLSRAGLREQLEELIPEYGWADIDTLVPEEKIGVAVRLFKSIKWHVLTVIAILVLTMAIEAPLWVGLGIPIGFDLFVNLLYVLSHKASGYSICDEGVIVSGGCFAKTYEMFTYKKMQILTMTYHPVAKKKEIGDGVIMLLDSVSMVPFIKRELAFEISNKIIGGTK